MGINLKDGRSFHKGHVVALITKHDVRIMSDVWANVSYAVVFIPGGVEDLKDSYEYAVSPWPESYKAFSGVFKFIRYSDSEFGMNSQLDSVDADASEEIKEIYQAYELGKLFKFKLDTYDADVWRMEEWKKTVSTGKFVRVVRGRKVPKGTEGLVFWKGNKGFGETVGIAMADDDGVYRQVTKVGRYGQNYQTYEKVVFVRADYVQVILGRD